MSTSFGVDFEGVTTFFFVFVGVLVMFFLVFVGDSAVVVCCFLLESEAAVGNDFLPLFLVVGIFVNKLLLYCKVK